MEFLKNWRDALWLLILLALAYLAYRIIPAIDPRSGIDGFGDLFNALVMAVKGIMATIGAYLCKRLYWWEPTNDREANWHDAIEGTSETIDRLSAIIAITFDRVEYLAWLAFWLFVLF